MSRTESAWTEEQARALTSDEINAMTQPDLRQAVRASGYVKEVPSLTVQSWRTDQLKDVLYSGTLPMVLEQPEAEAEAPVTEAQVRELMMVQDAAKKAAAEPPQSDPQEDKVKQLHALIEDIATSSKTPPVDLDPVWNAIGAQRSTAEAQNEEIKEHGAGLSLHSSEIIHLTEAVSTLRETADKVKDITDALASTGTGQAKRAKAVVGSTANPVLNKLMKYYCAGEYNAGNMISLEGPPGYGKSLSCNGLGETYGKYVVHGCSNDINEIDTLLGGTVPDHSTGGLIVCDGKLVEAFRAAAAGTPTLLFLDEHYRLPERAREWLLTLLQPINAGNGKRVFRVTTRRPVNGALEEIEADCDKLHIVAAANLETITPGGPYWDRFQHIRIDYDEKVMAGIVQHILDEFGIPQTSDNLAECIASIIGESREGVAEGRILYPLSPRDVYRAALFAPEPTEAAVAGCLSEALPDKTQAWDADTGNRVDDNGVITRWTDRLDAIKYNGAGPINAS